jgi:hypothetical protein
MIAAIVVGVWTALYLGVRAGVIAAAVTAAALFGAAILPIPGVSIAVYILVVGWCAALYFVIPKLVKPQGKAQGKAAFKIPGQTAASVASQANNAWNWAKKMLQR